MISAERKLLKALTPDESWAVCRLGFVDGIIAAVAGRRTSCFKATHAPDCGWWERQQWRPDTLPPVDLTPNRLRQHRPSSDLLAHTHTPQKGKTFGRRRCLRWQWRRPGRCFSLSLSLPRLILLPHFPEWPGGNQTTNKRVNKDTAYIDPRAL